ncbi:DUF5680 domain-containing protein [Kribbella sp. NPDC056951]|uniref:DUF5680 domain-containing protein n=1 Tax=Kribbella sp. NPDC056951 TaxID=3345978 RepID=UPI003631FE50
MISDSDLQALVVRAKAATYAGDGDLYAEGRFLGGFTYGDGQLTYVDENTGEVGRFEGVEHISGADGTPYYRLQYHGGRIV